MNQAGREGDRDCRMQGAPGVGTGSGVGTGGERGVKPDRNKEAGIPTNQAGKVVRSSVWDMSSLSSVKTEESVGKSLQ